MINSEVFSFYLNIVFYGRITGYNVFQPNHRNEIIKRNQKRVYYFYYQKITRLVKISRNQQYLLSDTQVKHI